jgi:hypothetical protein
MSQRKSFGAVALALVFLGLAPWSLASERPRPELLCTPDSLDQAFQTPFVIKANRREFCAGHSCWLLLAFADRLEYRCPPAGADGDCAAAFSVVSSAGPFLDNERLVIDLSTGRFEGLATGTVGDISRTSYASQLAGVCVPIAASRSIPK